MLQNAMMDAVPLPVAVFVSPDPAEIDLQMTSNPLAVDPLLIQNENVKTEVKREGITNERDTEVKGEQNMIAEAVSVIVPCDVSTWDTPSQHSEVEDPLRDVPNVSVVPSSILPSLPSIYETKKTEDLSKDGELETTHTNKSCELSSLQKIIPRNNESVETVTLEESANEATNSGRATRRSAILALAAIRQSSLSDGDADSNNSESDFENSDGDADSDSSESDYENSDGDADSDSSESDYENSGENHQVEQKCSTKRVSGKQNNNQRKGKTGKGADCTKALCCTCGKHSCSTLDKIDYQVGSHIVCNCKTVVQPTLQNQQMTLNTLTNKNNAFLGTHILPNDLIASKTLADISKKVMVHRQETRKQTFDILNIISNTSFIVNVSKEPYLNNSPLVIKNNSVEDVLPESFEPPLCMKVIPNSVQDNNGMLPPECKKMRESNRLSVSSESNETSENNGPTSSSVDNQQSRLPGSSNICFEVCEDTFTKSFKNVPYLKTSQSSYEDVNQNPQKQNSGDSVDQFPRKQNPDCPKREYVRKVISCSVCGFAMPDNRLKVHMMKHSDDRPVKCELCPKTFKYNNSLRLHIENVHKNIIHKCKVCGKEFKSKSYCRTHVNSVHNGKSYTRLCTVCGKTIHRGVMKSHMLIHSAVKSVPCNICDKKFRTNLCLKSHIRNIHELTKPRYICDVCGAKLKSSKELKDHANIHLGIKPYACKVCDKTFAFISYLSSHMQSHKERKFKCDICGYACKRLANLGTHMRSHTGEKPYKCIMCSKTFTRSDNLQTHKRLVHNIE